MQRVARVAALVAAFALGSAAHAWFAAPVDAQGRPPARQVITPKAFPSTGLPYSPGILVGDTLYISGQLGRDPKTAQLVPGGIEPETRQAIANIREVLREAGMDLADVVTVTAFVRDFKDFETFNGVYRKSFPTAPPARATVQVSALNLGAAVELQMIAVKPRPAMRLIGQ